MNEKKDINVVISNILKTGVYISTFFVVVGIILALVHGAQGNLVEENYTFKEMIIGLIKFNYYSYLMFGVFVLILTPILRILGLLAIYIEEKDYKFVHVCIIVLIILAISLSLGVTHN